MKEISSFLIKELLYKNKTRNMIREFKRSIRKNSNVLSYIKSNIPKEFWGVTLDNFDGDSNALRLVEKYCSNLKFAFKRGIGFLFTGKNGVGKTSLSTIILRKALLEGHTAFFITLPEIFRQIYLGFKYTEVLIELKKILYSTDFLAISEVGKDYHRSGSEIFMISEFDSILRERRGSLKPVIIDTNLDEVSLEDTYGASIISIFKSRLKLVNVAGKDYREVSQKKEVEGFFNDKRKK